MTKSISERFWPKVKKTESCWLWIGTIDKYGYGEFIVQYKKRKAHRIAYELVVGIIPKGLVIDHLCRVRACVNPEHLEPVTQRINVYRGESPMAKNRLKTHCPKGHEYSIDNTYISRYGRQCKTCSHNKEVERNKTRNRKPFQRRCPECLEMKPMNWTQKYCTAKCGAIARERRKYKTHCTSGHEYNIENTRFNKNGHRECRACGRLKYYRLKG